MTVVLGAMVIMLLVAGTVASQTRQELRMATAETDATKVQSLVTARFQEAAAKAANSEFWPESSDITDGTPCEPAAPYPSACQAQVLERRTVQDNFGFFRDEIPVRVYYKVSAASSTEVLYGWILIDASVSPAAVLGVVYDYHWCRPPDDLAPGACRQGG